MDGQLPPGLGGGWATSLLSSSPVPIDLPLSTIPCSMLGKRGGNPPGVKNACLVCGKDLRRQLTPRSGALSLMLSLPPLSPKRIPIPVDSSLDHSKALAKAPSTQASAATWGTARAAEALWRCQPPGSFRTGGSDLNKLGYITQSLLTRGPKSRCDLFALMGGILGAVCPPPPKVQVGRGQDGLPGQWANFGGGKMACLGRRDGTNFPGGRQLGKKIEPPKRGGLCIGLVGMHG